MKRDSIPYVVLFTFVVCAVFVTLLALANEGTKPLVEANKAYAAQAAVLDALGIPYADKAEAQRLYTASVSAIEGTNPRAYRATLEGQDYIAVEQTGAGLWGAITIVLAADPEARRIRGVQLVAQNETPGLGGRIEEAWFLGQFRGEAASGGVRIAVGAESKGTGDKDSDNGLVDGVTGASRTSSSFEVIVNEALKRVRAVAGGAK
jgi:Na+-transporting NADH:ubiquinone oxidoreductase subunit C